MAAENKIDVKITASPQEFVSGINKAQQALGSGMQGIRGAVASTASSVKASVASMKNAIGAAGIAVVGAFGTSANAAIEYQKALAGLARTSGMSVAASSELAFAASQVGMSTADLTKNIGFLARSLASLERDADNAGNVFNRFGISVHDANGALLPTDEILGAVADRFQRMPDGVEKTALAMSIFGREGRAMIPLLNQGRAGLEKMGEKAKSLEFRARAVMEANRLTEEEKEKQLAAYKEKIEATSWYKSALTEVLNAEKKLADYELTIQNKILEYQRTRALDSISLEEKRLEGLYNTGAITQEALLARQREFEEHRYNIQRTAAQKELADNALDIGKMTSAYEAYAAARTELDKEIYFNEMLLSSKNEEATIAALKSLEELYTQHAEKLLSIQQKQRDKEIGIVRGVRDTLTDEMSAVMQDVAKGSKSVLEGIRSLISSTMSSILKQITNRLSENIVQKAFANVLQKKSAPDMTAVAAEQTTQAARTAAAQAGAMQRTTIEQTSGAMQVAATTEKATMQVGVETAKDETIVTSSAVAGQASVASIQASMVAMLQMLPIMLLLSALTGLFGGGGSSKSESTGPGINLGRNPDSYYKTPRLTGIPSFDVGSWRLPADTLAMVHKDEMIVPAAGGQADGVRSLLSGGGSQKAPQINLTYSAVHTGRTDADVRREMRDNAKYMVKVLNSEYRKFNRGNLKG